MPLPASAGTGHIYPWYHPDLRLSIRKIIGFLAVYMREAPH